METLIKVYNFIIDEENIRYVLKENVKPVLRYKPFNCVTKNQLYALLHCRLCDSLQPRRLELNNPFVD